MASLIALYSLFGTFFIMGCSLCYFTPKARAQAMNSDPANSSTDNA